MGLTVKELQGKLDTLVKLSKRNEDLLITVVTSDPSVGALSQVDVKSVSQGIDWERGKLLVWTKQPVIKANKGSVTGD